MYEFQLKCVAAEHSSWGELKPKTDMSAPLKPKSPDGLENTPCQMRASSSSRAARPKVQKQKSSTVKIPSSRKCIVTNYVSIKEIRLFFIHKETLHGNYYPKLNFCGVCTYHPICCGSTLFSLNVPTALYKPFARIFNSPKLSYRQTSNIRRTRFQNLNVSRLVLQLFCPIYWSQMSSPEWKWSWSSADRRCSNYIWAINNFISY